MTRFWEPRVHAWVVQVLPGELYVTREPDVIATVLGSCVAACVRDVKRHVGGMNHFLLPQAPRGTNADLASTARYGVYALELLLNKVMRGVGRRDDLEVKVFGGGRVLSTGGDIGRGNIEFVRTFFRDEGIQVVSEDVGDTVARRLRYWPMTGRVQLMRMPMDKASRVVAEEEAVAKRLVPTGGAIELF